MNLDALDPGILGPALVAGLLVVATHVPLGMRVLERGIVFIDLAIAQIAGIGVIAAHALGWEPRGWAVQAVAVGAALTGAMLLTWTERRWAEVQEALIGVLFVLASCAGILLLAGNPHGGEHLRELLAGQILWVGWDQLAVTAVVTAAVLALWFVPSRPPGRTAFYLVFAVAVTASVQLVGVYLVFATLIVPALATRRLGRGRRLAVGYAVGVLGYASGLALSALFDLPSGAMVVWLMAAVGAAALAIRPGQDAAAGAAASSHPPVTTGLRQEDGS